VEAQFVFVSDLSAAIHDTVTDFTVFSFHWTQRVVLEQLYCVVCKN